MAQATGMAVPRYSTLTTNAVTRSWCDVASTARASRSPCQRASTHRSRGAKQAWTTTSVRQGAALSSPSYSHSRKC